MVKAAKHHVIWFAPSEGYRIKEIKKWGEASPSMRFDSQQWFQWLERIPSFHFQAEYGHFTARKERRARGGSYWIAYRHIGGKLVKRYIGTQSSVTIARLEHIASELQALVQTNAT